MPATTTSDALATLDTGPGAMIEKHRSSFATVLPSHVNADQWVRVAQGVMRRNQQLAQVATQNPGSFLSAMLDCARLGLEPGDTYHLVPFGREIVGIIDYVGEIELAYRAGAISSIKAEVVYENDHFHYEPSMARPDHKPDWFADRGDMIGVYAYAEMKDGGTSRVVVMSRADLEKVKAVSKTAKRSDSPWVQWEDRMWLKTAVKQLRRWIPTSAEYRNLVNSQTATAERVAVEIKREAPELAIDPHASDDDIADAEIVDDPADEAPHGRCADCGTPLVESGHCPQCDNDDAPSDLPDEPMTEAQSKAIHALLRQRGGVGPDRFPILTEMLGQEITTTKQISKAEASMLIDQMQEGEK